MAQSETFCLVRIEDRRNTLLVVAMRQIFLAQNNSDVYDVPATSGLLKKAANGRTRTLRVFVGQVAKAVTIVATGDDRAQLEKRITQSKRIPRIKRLTFSPMIRENLSVRQRESKLKNRNISAVKKKKELNEALTTVKKKMDQKALQIDLPLRTSEGKTGESGKEPLILPFHDTDFNCDGKALSTLSESSTLSKVSSAPASRRISTVVNTISTNSTLDDLRERIHKPVEISPTNDKKQNEPFHQSKRSVSPPIQETPFQSFDCNDGGKDGRPLSVSSVSSTVSRASPPIDLRESTNHGCQCSVCAQQRTEMRRLNSALKQCRQKLMEHGNVTDMPDFLEDITSNVREVVRDELQNTELIRNKTCGFGSVNGKAQVTPDVQLTYPTVAALLKAKSMQQRLNHIVKEYWTSSKRERLFLKPRANDSRAFTVTNREIAAITGVLEAIQERKKLPEENWQSNVKSWIGTKLKSDRNVKSRAATDILLRKLNKKKESKKQRKSKKSRPASRRRPVLQIETSDEEN